MADYEVEFTLEPQQEIPVELTLGDRTTVDADLSLDVSGISEHNLLLNRDLPDQHPISAITGLAEALQRADTFVFEQAVASDTWTIEHNLGKKPSVTVVDSADNVFYPAVQYINENKLVVTMNGATTGKAYLN